MSKKKISVIHGPNLNLLGEREPEHYGSMTLEDINSMLKNRASELNIEIDIFQSNSEAEIIEKIQLLTSDFTIINPSRIVQSLSEIVLLPKK
jgi:3-dehydroquinate dehydratase-2